MIRKDVIIKSLLSTLRQTAITTNESGGMRSSTVLQERPTMSTLPLLESSNASTLGFFPMGNLSGLFVGCETTGLSACCGRSAVVDLITIGVMKGGTTSLEGNIQDLPNYCRSASPEAHFFDDQLSADPVSGTQLGEYERKQWGRCEPQWPRFETSPNYFVQEYTPLRICEALGPQQKLLVILREPGARSFSEFAHHATVSSAGGRYHNAGIPPTPSGFDTLVEIEVAIVRHCGATPGPYFSPEQILNSTLAPWEQCCLKQAARHGFYS
uniref:Uncharacterized protein n=1 Tax=Haptolina ericina TaxID=156174 RepID=A0A7S3BQ23_9EUKA